MNTPFGLFGILDASPRDVRMRRLIASSAWSCPITRCAEVLLRARAPSPISSRSILPTGMPVQPEITSPTIAASTRDAHERRLALQRVELRVQRRRARRATRAARRCARRFAVRCASSCLAQLADRASTSARSCSQRALQRRRARASVVTARAASIAASRSAWSRADGALALEHALLHREVVEPALRVLDGRRRRVLAQREARARGVEHADRLVGQLAVGQVAMREPHRRVEAVVEDAHVVVLLRAPARRRAS